MVSNLAFSIFFCCFTSKLVLSENELTPDSNINSGTNRIYANISIECDQLQQGQYYCADPVIDNTTQQAKGCSKDEQFVKVPCFPVPGIVCSGRKHTGDSVGFYKTVPCQWTSGHHFSVALLLSVFLGMFGVDRFYLGYPAIGLLKLCTLGFMLLGQLIDVLLIALQVVGPSDGSYYVIDFYGPVLNRIDSNNETFIKPQYDLKPFRNASSEL